MANLTVINRNASKSFKTIITAQPSQPKTRIETKVASTAPGASRVVDRAPDVDYEVSVVWTDDTESKPVATSLNDEGVTCEVK